ncbi:MAG: protein phosphatase CheZ [Alphaproteobacteria bacterium]|jgi:chemotaxis protein CheZ
MDTEKVSAGIEQLVDHLRANDSVQVDLGDIAGVTEILLATMRRYFNSIDTTLYSEFGGLSEYIQRARTEISELRPNDLKQEKIPRAGLELEAIVASTEEATGTIMDAAEEIMSADAAAENYVEAINEACMRIFEACSFQDITGQRITKVVNTLTYIEERLHGLQDAWGPDIEDADGAAPEPGKDDDARPDKDLLSGPALDGEGILQDQVDDLLNGTADGGDSFDFDVATEIVATGPAMNPATSKQSSPAEGKGANGHGTARTAAKKAVDEPKLDDIVPLSTDKDEAASQDEIDALFD